MWSVGSSINQGDEDGCYLDNSDTTCATVDELPKLIKTHIALLSSAAPLANSSIKVGFTTEIIDLIPTLADPTHAGSTWEFILGQWQVNIDHRADGGDALSKKTTPMSLAEIKAGRVRVSPHGHRYSAGVRLAVIELFRLEASRPGSVAALEELSAELHE